MYRLDAADLERAAGAAARAAAGRVRVGARRLSRDLRARCGCGGGRTRSGSAGTASPRAAATRPPSPRCAGRGTSTRCAARTRRTARPVGPADGDDASVEHAAGRTPAPGYRTLGDAWLAETGAHARRRAAARRARGAADRAAGDEATEGEPGRRRTATSATSRRGEVGERLGLRRRDDPARTTPRAGFRAGGCPARCAPSCSGGARSRRRGTASASSRSRTRQRDGMSEHAATRSARWRR